MTKPILKLAGPNASITFEDTKRESEVGTVLYVVVRDSRTSQARTLGDIFEGTLSPFFRPYLGACLTPKDLREIATLLESDAIQRDHPASPRVGTCQRNYSLHAETDLCRHWKPYDDTKVPIV